MQMSGTVSSKSPPEHGSLEYDTPRSNPYMKQCLDTIPDTSGEGEGTKATTESRGNKEPVYAAPDEMNVFNNEAYATTRSLALKTEANIYSTMDALEKNADASSIQTNWKTNKKGLTYKRVPCYLISTFLLFISIGLASAALAIVLLRPDTTQSCNCMPNVETFNMLGTFQDRLDETSRELERSRQENRMLASLVAELSENTSALLAPLVAPTAESTASPSANVTQVLHNCTARVETQCRVRPGQRECQTPCVPETEPDSIATNFQCIRLESEEPNPLIGIIDVTGGEVLCLCYVIEINDNGPQRHPVDCALRATRCSLANLQA